MWYYKTLVFNEWGLYYQMYLQRPELDSAANSSDEHFKGLRMSLTKYFAILVDCSHCYLMIALHFQMQKTAHGQK
jgi:hypothetical protein